MDPLTLLSCYLAAVVHDYEHGGLTNDFLINTSDLLAVRWGMGGGVYYTPLQ